MRAVPAAGERRKEGAKHIKTCINSHMAAGPAIQGCRRDARQILILSIDTTPHFCSTPPGSRMVTVHGPPILARQKGCPKFQGPNQPDFTQKRASLLLNKIFETFLARLRRAPREAPRFHQRYRGPSATRTLPRRTCRSSPPSAPHARAAAPATGSCSASRHSPLSDDGHRTPNTKHQNTNTKHALPTAPTHSIFFFPCSRSSFAAV